MIDTELIGWIATLMLLLGYILNARKKISSWVIWMIGNTLMCMYAILIESNSIAFLSTVLVGLNIYGFISWKRQ